MMQPRQGDLRHRDEQKGQSIDSLLGLHMLLLLLDTGGREIE
jgi:hypothetical protein